MIKRKKKKLKKRKSNQSKYRHKLGFDKTYQTSYSKTNVSEKYKNQNSCTYIQKKKR